MLCLNGLENISIQLDLYIKHRHARRARVIFYEVSEIVAFMELFTVMIWLIWQVFLVAMYSKRETGNL